VTGPGVSYPANPYDIPGDNPFAGNAKCGPGLNANPCPEIYAWGLRNPWRWNFDTDTGQLWLADVGQNAYEEINLIERNGNYGWRCREGEHNYNTSGCGSGLIDPVSEYPHSLGNSITGGFVYRGSAIPALTGRYVFADYGSGRIWALQSDGLGGYNNDQLIDTNFGPTSFGVDQDGELYFTDINNGRLRMLVPAGPQTPDTIPELLSDSGCTDPGDITQPYAGLLAYDINAPFWSDGAAKDRYIGLPNGSTITRNLEDDWEFPNGTVIVKNFRLNGNLVETRHLMRHPDGVWAGYTYEWNALQTQATRVRGGKSLFSNGQDWIFPSESQCMECHTSAAGFALGPETAQLNRVFIYPSTGRNAHQLETIDQVLMFTSPLPAPVQNLPRLTAPSDTGASLPNRARAYLHTNCAQCHRPGGPTPSSMDLRYTTLLSDTNACDLPPLNGDFGIASARLIAPGDASRSLLIVRAGRRDSHGMPPLGSELIDNSGIALLSDWINGLANCNP
ncbi:MAG: PQQ-dependent sugar dehydrogenase, partial [Gammaproteobacteria bacterium]|nr:PQQ-dependent sugar dehydrogenase [Gammaproteobacteria bacterium]